MANSPELPLTDALVALQNDSLRVVVQPALGGGLTRFDFRWQGRWEPIFRPLEGPGADPEALACCPLLPWSNRLYGGSFRWRGRTIDVAPNRPGEASPLHGDAWLSRWKVVGMGQHELLLELDASLRAPFAYVGSLRYEVAGPRLKVTLAVENRGEEPMPFGLGLHPWLVRTDDTELTFGASGRWAPQASHPPRQHCPLIEGSAADFRIAKRLPDEPIDHVYSGWDGHARVEWPTRGLALDVVADAMARYIVVYAPAHGQRGSFFCIEPVSHRNGAHIDPDPMSQGLLELPSAGVASLSAEFRVQPLQDR